ncbi:MAG TPA: hypothetical protein VIX42_11350 [Edaphobacter sp.]
MTTSQKWAGHLAHPKWSAATAIHKQRKHVLTAVFRAALAVTAIVAIPRADAEPILSWGFQDVIFSSGQSAVGSFTVQGSLTDWNIQLIGGTDPAMTNLSFQPGGDCVVFCGELLDEGGGPPSPSSLDVRTPLASDNTFFELVVYFNAPFTDLFDPATAQIGVNSASSIFYEKLINPSTVGLLKVDELSTSAADARVVLTPEPASLFLFVLGSAPLAILPTYRLFRRKTAGAELN